MVTYPDREIVIRPATIADAAPVAGVYNHYVKETSVTFEEEEVSPPEIARRIQEVGSASLPWLIAERDAKTVGYAYATKWHTRTAYRFSAEITVYVDSSYQRVGFGSRLYDRLFPILYPRHARCNGGDRTTQRGERRPAWKIWSFESGSLQRGRLQVQPVDRCRLLATHPLGRRTRR